VAAGQRRNATALAIDAAHVRAGWRVPYRWSANDRWADLAEHIQTVVDLRRAVDVLESIGVERITFDGVSWSSTIGAVLAGVEPRIDGYALMVGGTVTGRFLREGQPIFPLNAEPDVVVEDWLALMATVDATQYVGDATSPILFQNGRDDTIVTPEDASAVHAAAGPEHEVRWYDGVGHSMSAELIEDRIRWMRAMWVGPGRCSWRVRRG
jgi:pimeloyl-ACP methyl ester carboxylesterase